MSLFAGHSAEQQHFQTDVHTTGVTEPAAWCDPMIVKVVELWCNTPGCKAAYQSRCLTGVGARAEAVKAGWTHVLTRVTRSGPAMSEDFCPDHRKEPNDAAVQTKPD